VLLALEFGVAAFHEGFDTFVVVVSLEDNTLCDGLVGHRLFDGFLEAFVEQAFGVTEGHLRAGSNLRGEFVDFLVELVGVVDMVDQPNLFGAVGPEDVAGED
jgi:hypothetical protein